MEEKKVYNGVIDWWKIVFCLIIVVMHVGEYYHGDSFIFIWGRLYQPMKRISVSFSR